MRLTRSRKWGLSGLFAIGAFAIFCAALRIQPEVELLKDPTDLTYITAKINFWGTCQITAGFLVACLPVMPTLYTNIEKQPWVQAIRRSTRVVLTPLKNENTVKKQTTQVTTIGGGRAGKGFGNGKAKKNATDREFELLVNTEPESRICLEARGNIATEPDRYLNAC